jgi:hypothetical protein
MIKITTRKKPISKGRSSLYLDYYPAAVINGKKTRTKTLRLYYIDNPQTPNQRRENKLAMEIAERARLQRLQGYNRLLYLTKFIYPQISAILRLENFVKIMRISLQCHR